SSNNSYSSRVGRLMAFVWRFLPALSAGRHRGRNDAGNIIETLNGRRLPRRKVLAVSHAAKAPCGLTPYTVYLITLKILFCVCLAHARQSSSPEAANGVALSTDSIKPLQIGDTIPEVLWHMPLQMVKAGQEG